MKFALHFTGLRLIAFILAALLPLAAIGLGVILIAADTIMNGTFIMSYIVLPVLTLLLLMGCIFGNKRIVTKIVLSILILVVFVFLFQLLYVIGKYEALSIYEDDQISPHYTQVEKQAATMPSLSEIGKPVHMTYCNYYSQQMIIFTCDVDYLICQYDDNEYIIQKEQLEEKYTFRVDKMSAHGYDCDPTVELDGYFFSTISGEDFYYPKRLMFIATNDDTNEIIYLSFYDDDLDYIVSLVDFLNDECGWKHIR